tara:strand:- start:269 stop:412 length:144 start_codon:yes stop_codon:yes gene_type:complete
VEEPVEILEEVIHSLVQPEEMVVQVEPDHLDVVLPQMLQEVVVIHPL